MGGHHLAKKENKLENEQIFALMQLKRGIQLPYNIFTLKEEVAKVGSDISCYIAAIATTGEKLP